MGLGTKIDKMLHYPRLCAKKSGHSTAFCFIDSLWCYAFYGTGITDYFCMRFYEKNHAERTTFITARRNFDMLKTLNDRSTWQLFSDKRQFNERFAKYLGRDILVLDSASEQQVDEFLSRHPKCIQKPASSIGGRGICLRRKGDAAAEILQSGGLLEEFVLQHEQINQMYDGAVNTLRVVTLMTKNGPEIFACGLRIGNGGIVDNVTSGGFSAGVDIQSGRLCTDGADLKGNIFETHPSTQTPIKGFQIPFFGESIAMVKEAAGQVPNCRYIGWDVAITPNGPLLIEANHNPGYHVYQVPENKGYYTKYLSLKND